MTDDWMNVDDNSDSIRISSIAKLANEYVELLNKIERFKEELGLMENAARVLSEIDIPNAMDDVGITSFTLPSGAKISVKEIVKANIPAKRIHEAVEWLEQNGGGDLIKTSITANLSRDDHSLAVAVIDAIKNCGVDAEKKDFVHWQTLTAWCRERIDAGLPLNAGLLGLYLGRKTEVK